METGIQELILWLLAVVTGLIGMPIVQFVKNRLGWEDNAALLLSGAIATVLALVQLFATGALGLGDFTLANFALVFTTVMTAANVFYEIIIGNRPQE